MNKVKRAARAHHYIKIGFAPKEAIGVSDNRTFKHSRHRTKGSRDEITKASLGERQSRIKSYIKRVENQIRAKLVPRKTV